MIHDLKIKPEFLESLLDGSKTFEVRKNDRGYQIGDILRFETSSCTFVAFEVTYILTLIDIPELEFPELTLYHPPNLSPEDLDYLDYIENGLSDWCVLGLRRIV